MATGCVHFCLQFAQQLVQRGERSPWCVCFSPEGKTEAVVGDLDRAGVRVEHASSAQLLAGGCECALHGGGAGAMETHVQNEIGHTRLSQKQN